MSILIDSNILCRLARSDDPQHEVAKKAVELCLQRREELLITPQAQREFWVVATRPRDKNGLGMSPISANLFIDLFPSLDMVGLCKQLMLPTKTGMCCFHSCREIGNNLPRPPGP